MRSIIPQLRMIAVSVSDQDIQDAFDSGVACGRGTECWAGLCPFEAEQQPALRVAWMNGFSVGRIEASAVRR